MPKDFTISLSEFTEAKLSENAVYTKKKDTMNFCLFVYLGSYNNKSKFSF